jgi:flavin-dependent thymidylate synthase
MAKVKLVNYTSDAKNLLIFTKNTRLFDHEDSYKEVVDWPEEKKQAELDYMLKTIKSSWEFIDYTFEVSGVSRGFTHQFVRTRNASYAQQSLRVVSKEGFDYVVPERLKQDGNQQQLKVYRQAMEDINTKYEQLLAMDVPVEDARGILPTNICTKIIAKFNLRTMHETAKSRLSPRAQHEMRETFKLMVDEVVKVHPWAKPFLEPTEWSAPSMGNSLNKENFK